MKSVPLAALVAFGTLSSSTAFASLSLTNYQFVNEQRVTLTKSSVTYRADLVNTGGPLASVTATLTSLHPGSFSVVTGQAALNFAPVPAKSQTTSSNTFTILVDRTITFDFANLQAAFQVTPVAPVANAGPNQMATVGKTVTLDGSKSTNPSGIGTLTYSWAFTSRPAGSTVTLMNPATVMPAFVPDGAGNYVITLTVSNGVESSSASVTVSTTQPPLPVANAGPDQAVTVGVTVVLNGSASTSGSGNPLTYSWTLSTRPEGSTATLTGANAVSPTFVADKPGTYMAQLIVNDGVANSGPSIVTVSTSCVKPVASAGPGQVVNVNSLVQLNGSGSTDACGLPLTFKWSLISQPGGSAATLSNTNIVNPTFTIDLPGMYVAQLIVNDGTLNSDAATVAITTNPVLAPAANAGPNQTVNAGSTVQLNGSGTDPQNLPVTFKWSFNSKPVGSVATLSSTVIPNPTFVADVLGPYVLQLTVNNGFKDSPGVTVTITTTCSQPTANPGQNQTVTVGDTVKLDGTASGDACADPLTYAWSFTTRPAGSTAALSGANTVSPSFVADAVGMYVTQLIVNNGVTPSNPATVTVTAVSLPAIALSPNPLAVSTNTPGTLQLILPNAAGADVALSSSNTGIATVRPSVTIPPGSNSATVTVTGVAAGSATITAKSAGLTDGTATVNVTMPSIGVALDSSTVGITQTVNGTVTLSAPAPPNDNVVINLDASPGGIAGFLDAGSGNTASSTIVLIGPGQISVPFTLKGLIAGASTIKASATGYTSGMTNLTVQPLGTINLPDTVNVGLTLSTTIPVSLSTPAPADVTVSLIAFDPNSVISVPGSVVILKGATTPATLPQVTGIGLGLASITATAAGYTQANTTVIVSVFMSFAESLTTINAGDNANLTLNLSGGKAPAGGLTINLRSGDTSVLTVPATVSFPANATTVNVPVKGVAGGLATIIASANQISDAGEIVRVNPGKISLPSTLNVAVGQSAQLTVSLSAPAPADLTVTLTSSDTSKVSVPASIVILKGATMPATQPQVTGVGAGSATVNASTPGYTSPASPTVVTVTAMAGFDGAYSGTTGQNKNFAFVIQNNAVTWLAGGVTVTGPAGCVAEFLFQSTFLPPVALSGNSFSLTGSRKVMGTISPAFAATGSLTESDAGICTFGSATANTTWNATLKGPSPAIAILDATIRVAAGHTGGFLVTLSTPAQADLTVTLTSSDPSIATVPATFVILKGATSPASQPEVTGVAAGSATITASAPGFTSLSTTQVQVF